MNRKQRLVASLVVFIIGLLMAYSVCSSSEIFSQPKAEVMKILSNAFFLPGVVFFGLGLLIFISNFGIFDIFDFSAKQMFAQIGSKASVKEKRAEFRKKYPDFYTYTTEKKKRRAQYTFMLLPGFLFILLSVIFTVLFFQV